MRILRLALAQINPTVGDLVGNKNKIINYIDRARQVQADLVAFPEMAIPGYPPEDLLFKTDFLQANVLTLGEIVEASENITVVVGFAEENSGVYNAAAIADNGKLAGIYRKTHLPNYGVFDEKRYFNPGTENLVFIVKGTYVGINICEDIWRNPGPAQNQSAAGGEVIVNISASPFFIGKITERQKILGNCATENNVFVAYVNSVGGQDELVFDGGSMIIDPNGKCIAQGNQFEESLVVADLYFEQTPEHDQSNSYPNNISKRNAGHDEFCTTATIVEISKNRHESKRTLPTYEPINYDALSETYDGLVTGTHDYVQKGKFNGVIIALSGGIDSSLVATIATDALGSDRVKGVSMPSRYSSGGSVMDARELAKNLGIQLSSIPIEKTYSSLLETLEPHVDNATTGLVSENLQSRIRGNLIMALSNESGWLVLTTGNKSEMAVGYATLYGDMVGGYAVIKDVPKTMVYDLARHRNSRTSNGPIPVSILEKPPSAELRPDQKDEDSLPPYEILDPILKAYVEDDLSYSRIVELGFEPKIVREIILMVDRSEYKRRQSPPGIKITDRNFGRDRRMPIINRYSPI